MGWRDHWLTPKPRLEAEFGAKKRFFKPHLDVEEAVVDSIGLNPSVDAELSLDEGGFDCMCYYQPGTGTDTEDHERV